MTQSSPKPKLKVSLFQIPEEYKVGLAKVAAQYTLSGKKKSINTCILEALESYMALPQESQPQPELKISPLFPYTVRMTEPTKSALSTCAASWQLKSGTPITMNAVVNTAISIYLDNH